MNPTPLQPFRSEMLRYPDQTSMWLNTLRSRVDAMSPIDSSVTNLLPTIVEGWQDIVNQTDNNRRAISSLQDDVSDIKDEMTSEEYAAEIAPMIVKNIYAIGDIVFTASDDNPATRFGGTWERVAEGKLIVGYSQTSIDAPMPNDPSTNQLPTEVLYIWKKTA